MTTSSERRRAYAGPVLFSFGFRPFFLFATLWSAIALPLWAWSFIAGDASILSQAGRDWHVHEMLFGVLGGVAAGFLLTAVPNWTGRLPVTGAPLAALFGLWAAGRAAMLFADALGVWAAVIDSSFLIVFAGFVWREIVAGGNRRNLPVAVLVSLFALGNLAFHLSAGPGWSRETAIRVALAVAAMLIALIGGRIVPSFTRNWLAKRGGALPAQTGRFDIAVLILTAMALALWTAAPFHTASGAGLAAVGALTFIRLARWRFWRTGSEPLVWILHAGYAWLAAGLTLTGLAILAPGAIAQTAGLHALTAGAIGVITLAVMTRATLGHTGRLLAADRMTLAVYGLINAAALVRVGMGIAQPGEPAWIAVSAVLWTAAQIGFILRYGPMLVSPKRTA